MELEIRLDPETSRALVKRIESLRLARGWTSVQLTARAAGHGFPLGDGALRGFVFYAREGRNLRLNAAYVLALLEALGCETGDVRGRVGALQDGMGRLMKEVGAS